jgi:hypothetical protein
MLEEVSRETFRPGGAYLQEEGGSRQIVVTARLRNSRIPKELRGVAAPGVAVVAWWSEGEANEDVA